MFVPAGSELALDRTEARILLVCDGHARLRVDDRPLGEFGLDDIVVLPGSRIRQLMTNRRRGCMASG